VVALRARSGPVSARGSIAERPFDSKVIDGDGERRPWLSVFSATV
jgi:hypothetical protein